MCIRDRSQDGICSDQSAQEVTVILPDTTNGVSELDLPVPFRFGPNPFGPQQTFTLTPEQDLASWSLYDALGRQVAGGGDARSGRPIRLAGERLEPGLYTMSLLGEDGHSWSVTLVRR